MVRSLSPALATLRRELTRRRRLNRAAQRGTAGGGEFFSALFELQAADDATEYVSRVRTALRGDQFQLDRRLLRLCIALLQDPPASSEAAPGIPADGLRRLAKWRGDSPLLDELGRLDEQLRAR